MSTMINTGWLKDKNREKFAPKTLTSQVVNSDGVSVEQLLANVGTGSLEVSDTAPTNENIEVWIKPDGDDSGIELVESDSATYNLVIGIDMDGEVLNSKVISSNNISIKQGTIATAIEKIKNRQNIKVIIEYVSYYYTDCFVGMINPYLITAIDTNDEECLAIEMLITAIPSTSFVLERFGMVFNPNGTLINTYGAVIKHE